MSNTSTVVANRRRAWGCKILRSNASQIEELVPLATVRKFAIKQLSTAQKSNGSLPLKCDEDMVQLIKLLFENSASRDNDVFAEEITITEKARHEAADHET